MTKFRKTDPHAEQYKRTRKPKNKELTDEELLADAWREAMEWQERKKNGQIF